MGDNKKEQVAVCQDKETEQMTPRQEMQAAAMAMEMMDKSIKAKAEQQAQQLALIKRQQDIESMTDSLEIGTAGKGGCIKLYGSFEEPAVMEAKLREAVRLRELGNQLLATGQQ